MSRVSWHQAWKSQDIFLCNSDCILLIAALAWYINLLLISGMVSEKKIYIQRVTWSMSYIYTTIQKIGKLWFLRTIILNKGDKKSFYNYTKNSNLNLFSISNLNWFQINGSFDISIHQRVLNKTKMITVSTTLSSTTVFKTTRNVSWAANQLIKMISEGSRDTEDWSNNAENAALTSKNYM